MAELTPMSTAQRPSEPSYQPLSGYAVAAVVTAGLFAVIMIVLVGVGLWSRRTPLSEYLLTIAIAGAILAVVGRSHIRNSEGTRTGMKLTNAAWWICVLGGAAFGAFLLANYLVLQNESRRTADGFLDALKAGQEHRAFNSFVLPPELRGRATEDSPDFELVYAPAGYPVFTSLDLVHAIRRNGPSTQIAHIGSKDVGQEGNGFKATHVYRVSVNEGVFDVQIKLVASEPRGGGKPEWHVQSGQGFGITKPDWEYFSQYGRLSMELENESVAFARQWMFELTNGRPAVAILSTLPRAERVPREAALHFAMWTGGPAILSIPSSGSGKDQTEFDQLLRAGFFRLDTAGNPLPEPKLAKLRELWASPTIGPASAGRRNPAMGQESAERSIVTLGPTALTIGVQADLVYGMAGRQFAPVSVGIVCTDPEIVSTLTAMRALGSAAKYDGSVTIRTLPPRNWQVVWFQTDMEQPAGPPQPPGARVGPGGPGDS